ncbi:ORC-CDC6 family AAA ATPase [Clostridium estertheticum]|uniref:Uncharacterized protein n=2 Tax=Clostridium estertheticum TaxID=238834 RepID=A0A1J0GD15_9CLOT|nr:hypothetical protein [Clostridium estertheticum]APC38880.1 hypothetical protein A7L45_01750 [Clostridium estertheticum subsp. estertheticum]WAG75069.1 ATP-binding protein [Clostridium estertheticum]
MPVIQIPNAFFQHDAQSKFNPETHIDPGFSIDKYISKDGSNTLIEGIRGTGKTHILKMISTRLIENFQTLRVLPVYISMAEVAEYVTQDTSLFRIHLYSTIIIEAVNTIKINKSTLNKKSTNIINKVISELAELFGLKESNDIDYLISEIEEYSNKLHQSVLNNPVKLSQITKDLEEYSGGLSYHGINASAKSSTEDSLSIDYLTIRLSHLNASKFITQFFKYLCELFDFHHTILLIDECSDLPPDAQTEIFRLFKLIRGGTRISNDRNYLYFIGGVYPPQATSYPSKALGSAIDFEPGDDCSMEYLEIDIQVSFYENFFNQLFYKKMKIFNPTSYNVSDYFEDEKAFLLAVYASNGLPRRFFEILHQSYETLCEFYSSEQINDNKTYKIRYSDVSSSIDKIVTSTILTRSKFTKEDFETFEKIVAALKKRNKKVETESSSKNNYVPINFYFTCPRSKEELIGNLISKGVIHNQSRTRSLKNSSTDTGTGKGLVMMIDLAIAFTEGAIPTKSKALEYFKKDTKLSAKRGYESCQSISF